MFNEKRIILKWKIAPETISGFHHAWDQEVFDNLMVPVLCADEQAGRAVPPDDSKVSACLRKLLHHGEVARLRGEKECSHAIQQRGVQ